MIISMQGNWTVRVKAKNAAYSQRFVISGAIAGNGAHTGTVGTSVNVTGDQWSIAIQNNPGGGYQLSDSQIKFPHQVGSNYEFEIWSNDAGGDADFNDLILACSTPVNINDFMIYGNVSLYSGLCIFNPCRPLGPFVIETMPALKEALKNPKLRKVLEKDYPERVREDIIGPIPPDPAPFKPMVIDINQEAMQPKTELVYQQLETANTKSRASKSELVSRFSTSNFNLVNSIQSERTLELARPSEHLELAKVIDGLFFRRCTVAPATNITLTFEEYDRSAAELAGGPYTGTGNRRLLGDTITDMHGNYIFRFSFDMTFPGIEDATDIAAGESMNVVAYPDVIVKVTGFSPYTVLYESAPYYNIPNLRRINLCLPKSQIQPSSACFNGNLIGSLGNVFIGGNQNSTASDADLALRRYGNGNELEASGEISVGSTLAGFNIDCAAWSGIIDFKGCMYDLAKTVALNKIKWYTIRIKRDDPDDPSDWQFVSENYKHPKFHKRHLPGYNGDDVGPFTQSLKVDSGPAVNVPAYINIQREIFVDGIDWEFSNLDRYMRLNTRLYDKVSGERVPDKFFVRVDCYDNGGNPVANGTDMIALFIHNNPLNFGLTAPQFIDPSVVYSGCGLYRLTDAQLNSPIAFNFIANDPEGFVHWYDLSMRRCPAPMLALTVNDPIIGSTPAGSTPQPHPTTPANRTTLFNGISASEPNACAGYMGTIQEFSDAGMIRVEVQPDPLETGWIRTDEYFSRLSFYLRAYKRVTNGYNSGLSDDYEAHAQLLMERINP